MASRYRLAMAPDLRLGDGSPPMMAAIVDCIVPCGIVLWIVFCCPVLLIVPCYPLVRIDPLYSNAMQCNTMQCNTMQCNTMQYDAIQIQILCNAMQYNTMQCNTIQCNRNPAPVYLNLVYSKQVLVRYGTSNLLSSLLLCLHLYCYSFCGSSLFLLVCVIQNGISRRFYRFVPSVTVVPGCTAIIYTQKTCNFGRKDENQSTRCEHVMHASLVWV